jgi:hypothetical protein
MTTGPITFLHDGSSATQVTSERLSTRLADGPGGVLAYELTELRFSRTKSGRMRRKRS